MARKESSEPVIDPVWALREGAAILLPTLKQHGFEFHLVEQGPSSGGHFASGEFRGGKRRIELHYRYSLGLVRYHDGDLSLSHENFMKGIGAWGRHHYPGFTNDPLEPFRQLRNDLSDFAGEFLNGTMDGFAKLAEQYKPTDSYFPRS